MDAFAALNEIREKRLRQAQTEVYIAHQRIEEKEGEIKKEAEALKKYEEELPELIRQLYLDVLGAKVDVSYVQEKVQTEIKLTQKKQDYLLRIKQLETELEQAQEALRQAQANMAKQERKKEGMQELMKDHHRQQKRAEDQKLAKVIDELASLKYIKQSKK
jgi:septal ring factor EnvC (AmiA/AmiB activator)